MHLFTLTAWENHNCFCYKVSMTVALFETLLTAATNYASLPPNGTLLVINYIKWQITFLKLSLDII